MDAMRRLLEGSWDESIMGAIPDTPETAANEAGRSLVSGRDRGLGLMVVNLLLPSYDITQGLSFYDEVEAVSFCVALSKFLESKACIVVRDNKTKYTVTRVLEAREEAAVAAAAAQEIGEDDEEEDSEAEDIDDTSEEEEDGIAVDEETKNDSSATEDDKNQDDSVVIGEFGSKGDTRTGDTKKSDMSDFRKQLMADWDVDGDDDAEDSSTSKPTSSSSQKQSNEASSASTTPTEPTLPAEKNYRITSMFGDATFKDGPDMFDKVIQAVSVNGQPSEEEDTLVILSAASKEETIGVRALASKFQKTKTIILVNCHFDPVPVEIVKAETVYSLLPLAAKPQGGNGNNNNDGDSPPLPKVVVLRRYPRDFEVFMDFGKGFELTESVSTSQVGIRGPSLVWIAERLKQQMQARYR